jgi:hypothetical protein
MQSAGPIFEAADAFARLTKKAYHDRKSAPKGVAFGHAILYPVSMAAQGIYRKRNAWGDQHSVRVKYDGGSELEVPEQFYRAEGWQPPFDELPWQGESGSDGKESESQEAPQTPSSSLDS